MFPICYTKGDGGLYFMWPKGFKLHKYEVDRITLGNSTNICTSKKGNLIFHSLVFKVKNDQSYVRWDSINGWTGPINLEERNIFESPFTN